MNTRLLSLVALCVAVRAQTTPQVPAIPREVTGVVDQGIPGSAYGSDARFRRAHIPALRTTADGRVAVIVEGVNPHDPLPGFFTLMAPEKLGRPALLDSNAPFDYANSYTVSQPGQWPLPTLTPTGMPISHVCLWDNTPPTTNAAGQDIYDLSVFVTSNYTTPGGPRTQFFVTPVTITVSNPKTPTASITALTTGARVDGPPYNFETSGFEPVICGDGRLLVTRIFSSQIPWPPGSTTSTTTADIVYSYYDPPHAPADPSQWTELLPISHAPFDARINTKFGFARTQFRDATGQLIADGEDLGGSYPWIDREAKNLFLEAVHDRLQYPVTGGGWLWRYPQTTVPLDPWALYGDEDAGDHQGVSFLGLWSHGKLVQLDTLNNDMDYAIGGVPGPQQRLVTLFQPNTGPMGNEPAELQLGYGRATERMPVGENDNANIIDSLESKFAYRKFMRPITLRDVVWHMNNSKQTDEFAFDDYIDPDALIVANMNGCLTNYDRAATTVSINPFKHHSGWSNRFLDFSEEIWLQNAATSPGWSLPPYGLVTGAGRLEPAATGGVHGKGFWMTGANGVSFAVPDNGAAVASHDWYVGIFVDCRFADDGLERRLLTFPDNTSVRLSGRHQLLYGDSNGNIVHRITLPTALTSTPANALDDLLPQLGWAHLAFQIRRAGKDVEFLLDGLPYDRWQHFDTALFQPTVGAMSIGQVPNTMGFLGWIDDFKVLAHTVDPETACNHAGGTLIGLQANYAGDWRTLFADRYPAWAHAELANALAHRGETTYAAYACYHDYRTDHGAYLGNLPGNTVSLRQAMHFPEGPLFHDAPRPNTTGNSFCTSCHGASGIAGLGLGALTFSGTAAAFDPRRQPSQPPPLLFGAIPANLVESDTGSQPPAPMVAPPSGQPVDQLMMPSWTGPATIRSFSLLDAAGTELDFLTFGKKVDPGRLGTTTFRVRANLDSAQGSVQLSLDAAAVNAPFGPYVVPATVAALLAPGPHRATGMPVGGLGTILDFTVLGNTKRTIAGYRADFQAGSPKPGWFYCWNKNGQLAASASAAVLAQLNWLPANARYTENGLVYPENSTLMPNGMLNATGGYPGRGSGQSMAMYDRFVLAGYQAKIGGYYGIDDAAVTSTGVGSNGGQIAVYTQSGPTLTRRLLRSYLGGQSASFTNLSLGLLAAGDIVWVAVGPRTTDVGDAFDLDFSIAYSELFF